MVANGYRCNTPLCPPREPTRYLTESWVFGRGDFAASIPSLTHLSVLSRRGSSIVREEAWSLANPVRGGIPRLLNRWKLLQLLFLTRRKTMQRIDLMRESLCCHDGVIPRPRQTSRSAEGSEIAACTTIRTGTINWVRPHFGIFLNDKQAQKMRCLTKGRRSFYLLSSVIVTLVLPLGALSSHADSADDGKRTKRVSSRQNTSTLACDKARKSATNRATLDCRTSGGLIESPEFSKCTCNPMGAKALCSVTITYECK